MIITPFALLILLLGMVALFRGTAQTMFSLFLLSTLFGGSAALILVAAGGSSIPPAQFLLLFLALRMLLPGPGQMETLQRATWGNRFLLAFTFYGLVSAFTLPTIFARLMVTPLKPIPGADLFAVAPLHMTSQNFTTAFYLLGTLTAGIATTAAMERPGAAPRLVRVGATITLVHAMLGISSVVLAGTAWDQLLGLFRNGTYAQLNQSFDGLVRMSGVWPEVSGFAAYGSIWCIFMIELWLRDVSPRRTGPAGLIMLFTLVASTSSSAYVSLSGYGLFVLLRFALRPLMMTARKQLALMAIGLFATAIVLGALVALPHMAGHFIRVLTAMTVEKSSSGSGIQRAFWAKQGIDLFVASHGLGVGAGSFRSSSVLTAILGSMGLIGIVTFLAHLLRSAQPFRSDFLETRHDSFDLSVGRAASTTACLMLAPAIVASPTPDPGVMWAVICGIAIALRPRLQPVRPLVFQRRAALV